MNKNHVVLSCLCFFFTVLSGGLFAQNKQVLEGQIHADSLTGIPVDIVNITAKKGTTSQADGSFSIKVSPGDSLLFSSLLYRAYYLKVTEDVLAESPISVYLKPEINTLSEVNISTSALSGDLEKDVATIPDNYFDQAKIGFPKKEQLSTAERHLYTATAPGAGAGLLLVPVEALINAISGRTKMLKRQVAYEHVETNRKKVLRLLSRKFFTGPLNLPEGKIDLFIYSCLDSETFLGWLRLEKVPEMMVFCRKKARDFETDKDGREEK